MARKSRKNLPQPEQAVISMQFPELDEGKIPTAIYGRLSVEDNEDNESMETQIALVQDFINRSSELNYVDTYFDNGFTGTNFKRPAFTRLMNDVRQKKIKCIVVKDLSRFGRNYLEAGYYIETVFPFLGVRLIAVNDNFDSTRKEDMESMALPIRNMINTMYAKDISKKVWSSLQRKKEAGYAVGSDAPFGYIRNPVTKRNEIDPETAFYVQLIFQWALMGVAIYEIARRMTLLQVPTPREWHRKIVEGKDVVTYKKWGETSIRHMLANQTYVGDTINNKSTQKFFAGQDKRDLSKEQWYVAKNTHPAIIARDDFEKVQDILAKNQKVFKTVRAETEQIRTEYQNDLAGMVFCADCGRSMDFDRLPHGAEENKKVCYYICRARQADDKCIGHQITEKLLKALVMDQLHLFIVRLSDKRKILEELRKIEDMQNPAYRAKSEVMSLTDKVGQIAKKREQLYADYVAGAVDSEEYQQIREEYSRQYDSLRTALQRAEAKKMEVEQQIREYLNMTSNLEAHLDDCGFDAQLVKSLVQRIEVSADKRIRIVFGFQDVLADFGSRRKTSMEQELKNLKGEKMRMYEEYAAGTLSLDNYKNKKQEYDRKIAEVQDKIEQSKAAEAAQSVVPGTVRAAAEQAENFLHGTRLTASMVSAFIENVYVHEGGRIVVQFKYRLSVSTHANRSALVELELNTFSCLISDNFHN